MQGDGNLVLTESGTPIWASNTRGSDVRLVVQDDRNVVLYAGDGTPLWATNTLDPSAASAPPNQAPPSEAPEARTYTVESGDTLWGIAERFYGDGSQHQSIADANGIPNPDSIRAGQRLVIPR
jgi:LysM repeat protein